MPVSFSPIPTGFSTPSPSSVFVPTFDEQMNLIIDYSKNEKDFSLNKWIFEQTVGKIQGFYPRFVASDAVRVPYSQGQNYQWPDGQPRPQGTNQFNNPRFAWLQYLLQRYDVPGTVGYVTQDQAEWDVKKSILANNAGLVMTIRTVQCVTTATTSSNYQSSHVNTATLWGGSSGGFWTAGTVQNPTIKRTLDAVASRILLDANGKAKRSDLNLIINPNLANAISESQEVHDYLARQVGAYEVLTGQKPSQKEDWGIPNPFYGYQVVCEYANQVTTLRNTTPLSDVASFVLSDNTSFVAARPGELTSEFGGSPWSTIHLLILKGWDLLTTIWDDVRNQLFDIFVTDFYTPLMVSPETGALITNCQQ